MRIRLPEDQLLLDAIDRYYYSKDLYKFREVGGVWLIHRIKHTFRLSEDDASEIYLTFHGSAKKCLEGFKKNKSTNFIAYFNVYIRYMVWNHKRHKTLCRKREYNSTIEYLQYSQNDLSYQNKYTLVIDYIYNLPVIEKFIFILRYNLKMDQDDLKTLELFLKEKSPYTIEDILQLRNQKWDHFILKREKLNNRMYAYNRKILKARSSEKIKVLKNRKKITKNFLSQKDAIFSIRELCEIFQISISNVNTLLTRHLRYIKRNY